MIAYVTGHATRWPVRAQWDCLSVASYVPVNCIAKTHCRAYTLHATQLSDGAAESLGSRIEDFLIVCKPGSVAEQEVGQQGPDERTVVCTPRCASPPRAGLRVGHRVGSVFSATVHIDLLVAGSASDGGSVLHSAVLHTCARVACRRTAAMTTQVRC